jgi:hypothetical protein
MNFAAKVFELKQPLLFSRKNVMLRVCSKRNDVMQGGANFTEVFSLPINTNEQSSVTILNSTIQEISDSIIH